MASPQKVALGSLAFSIFWIMAVFPRVPLLPIGRTAGTLLSASLMVVLRVLTPSEAFDSIDLPILALLFGTMVVGAYLERCDMFKVRQPSVETFSYVHGLFIARSLVATKGWQEMPFSGYNAQFFYLH